MSRPWMPFYVGDYLADTQHLTTLQHGAYCLLIMNYWQMGGPPPEGKNSKIFAKNLQKISGLSDYQWSKNSGVLAKLFLPGWRHKRIDQELKKADEIRTNRIISGSIGGLRRANKSLMGRVIGEALARHGPQADGQPTTTTYSKPSSFTEPSPVEKKEGATDKKVHTLTRAEIEASFEAKRKARSL